jgi:hypothetical protein
MDTHDSTSLCACTLTIKRGWAGTAATSMMDAICLRIRTTIKDGSFQNNEGGDAMRPLQEKARRRATVDVDRIGR